MSGRGVSGFLFMLLSMGVLVSALSVKPIGASGTIYIRADGSVDGTMDITSGDNVTYVLTADVNDRVVVQRSGIVIDGNGHVLDGSGLEGTVFGFVLPSVTNVTIRNTGVRSFSIGIALSQSSGNTITGNTVNCSFGIRLFNSSNNTVSLNEIDEHDYGILVVGSGNIIRGNSISSQVGTDHAGIRLASCFNNSVSGNKISNSSAGISLLDCSDSNVSGNDVAFCSLGILLDSFANGNTVFGNSIHANEYGFHLSQYASYNVIRENSVALNSIADICTYASDNYIYHNNLTTSLGVIIYSGSNRWDNGYPSGGNYWSDYMTRYPNATEIDASGLGDVPYVVNANNTDRYPLMAPYIPEFASTLFASALIVPITMIAGSFVTIACRRKERESEP